MTIKYTLRIIVAKILAKSRKLYSPASLMKASAVSMILQGRKEIEKTVPINFLFKNYILPL